jgi:hypothetical protein
MLASRRQRRHLVRDRAGLVQDLADEQRLAALVDRDIVRLLVAVLELDAERRVGGRLELVEVELRVLRGDLDGDLAIAGLGRRRRLASGARGDVGVVLLAWHRVHHERHEGVVDAAELGALAGVRAGLADDELELVGVPVVAHRNEVALDEELGHVERVVHIG